MKKLVILAIGLCFCINAEAQQRLKRKGAEPVRQPGTQPVPKSLYSLSQLTGRWQETNRWETGSGKMLNFTDTLLIRINGKKSEVRDATSMAIGLKGEAMLEDPDQLSVAADVFTILSLDSSRLLIEDGDYKREMSRKTVYYHETVGKTTVETEKYENPVTVNLKAVTGKWTIYRRQADAGARNDDQVLLKSLDIREIVSDQKAIGEVAFYSSGLTETITCSFIFSDGNLTIESEKHNWTFYTYKGTTNELVFGENGKFIYYAKH